MCRGLRSLASPSRAYTCDRARQRADSVTHVTFNKPGAYGCSGLAGLGPAHERPAQEVLVVPRRLPPSPLLSSIQSSNSGERWRLVQMQQWSRFCRLQPAHHFKALKRPFMFVETAGSK